MTIKKPGLALLVTFVSVFGLSQTASAAPCTKEVNALKTALSENFCPVNKRKRCEGLSHKLDNVNRQLEKGKFRKAARKLANFGDVVGNMSEKRMKKMEKKGEKWRRRHSYGADEYYAAYAALMNPFFNNAANCIANGGPVVVEDPVPTDGGGSEPPPAPTVSF